MDGTHLYYIYNSVSWTYTFYRGSCMVIGASVYYLYSSLVVCVMHFLTKVAM
jgi:hypothetical protein